MLSTLHRLKKYKKLFTAGLCILILFSSFAWTYGYLDKQSFLNASFSRELSARRSPVLDLYDAAKGLLVYKKISSSFKKYPDDSVEKLEAMVQWVHNNIRPQFSAPVITGNDNFYNILRRGTGYCDNDAQAFDILAYLQGYKVHSLALYDKKAGLSPHTLNEIYWDGKWVLVDPWMDIVFVKDGKLMTKEDVIEDSSVLNDYNYPEVVTSETLKDSFILKPFPLNALGKVLGIFCIADVFAPNALEQDRLSQVQDTPNQAGSNNQSGVNPKSSPQIEKLLSDYNNARNADILGDYKRAYNLYNSIQNSSLLSDLKEAIDYQKAVALYNSGNYKDSEVLLNNFLEDYNESDWKPSVSYFLAQIAIKNNNYGKAAEYLKNSDDAVNRNMLKSLKDN